MVCNNNIAGCEMLSQQVIHTSPLGTNFEVTHDRIFRGLYDAICITALQTLWFLKKKSLLTLFQAQ